MRRGGFFPNCSRRRGGGITGGGGAGGGGGGGGGRGGGDGVICDETLQTSVEGIYAAGDMCSYESRVHGRRLRIEHWDVAMQQGQHVGRAMAGEAGPYEGVPYFFSDLADWVGLEYVGPAEDWDEIVWRGDRDAGGVCAFFLQDDKGAGAPSLHPPQDP